MADSYVSLIEKRARQQLEDLNTAQQRAVIEAYNSAGKELVRRYRNAKDGTATKAMLASYAKKIAEETEELIKQYAIKGAEVAPSVQKLIMNQAFQMAGLDTSVANDKFNNIIGTLGKESVKNVIGGKIYKDGAGLSDRIWQASAQSSNKIQEVITACLAQDMGASEMSKILQAYVNPTARKTWSREKIREKLGPGYAAWNSNLEYNALRLARTTLAHTATMSMRQSQKLNPYASKIQWHSVHAGDRTCQICIDMDGNIYDTDKCPFDHPNGMCYQTTVLEKPLDEIANELADWCNGAENEKLDNWWEELTGEKPSPSIKEYINYELISRQKLKEMAESHIANRETAFERVFGMVSEGKITKDEAKVLLSINSKIYNEYVGTANSFAINRYLRELGDGQEIDKHVSIVKSLDYAIDNYQFDTNVKLRRFVTNPYLEGTFGTDDVSEISKQIGNVYKNKQYMSATVDSNPYFSDRPAIMTIECDKGVHAFPTTNYEEGEIILGRNTEYELVDVIDHRNGNPLKIAYEDYGQSRDFEYEGIEIVVRFRNKTGV